MQISERSVGDVMILDLKGRLILDDGFEPLRLELSRVIGDGWRKVLLNLADVVFLDSAGYRLDRVQVHHAGPARRPAEAVQSSPAQSQSAADDQAADGVRSVSLRSRRAEEFWEDES